MVSGRFAATILLFVIIFYSFHNIWRIFYSVVVFAISLDSLVASQALHPEVIVWGKRLLTENSRLMEHSWPQPVVRRLRVTCFRSLVHYQSKKRYKKNPSLLNFNEISW